MPSSSREEEVCPSSPKKENVMTLVIFFRSPVQRAREEEICTSSPKKEGVMTMVIFFLSLVERCEGDHGISSIEEEVCSSHS